MMIKIKFETKTSIWFFTHDNHTSTSRIFLAFDANNPNIKEPKLVVQYRKNRLGILLSNWKREITKKIEDYNDGEVIQTDYTPVRVDDMTLTQTEMEEKIKTL